MISIILICVKSFYFAPLKLHNYWLLSMAIVTFMSDFGIRDHYVSAVKAKIYSINPSINIVDISHTIKPFDLSHASYVLSAVFRDFPKGTIHLCAVDSIGTKGSRFVAVKLEDHFFVGNDNGLYSLLSDKEPSMIAELFSTDLDNKTFPAKDILAKAAAMLASGSSINDVGNFTKTLERKIARKSRATKKQISGNVIHIDHYGNLITNIEEEVFNIIRKERGYTIQFAREKLNIINRQSNEPEDGDCFVIFNREGFLEIGINKGNASELLGLKFDSPVNIFFDEE